MIAWKMDHSVLPPHNSPPCHTDDNPRPIEYPVLVIPAFNEEATIRTVVENALLVIAQVIVVDDGSTDLTVYSLKGLPVTLLRQPQNSGKAASLWVGFQHALRQGATAILTLDGDGQHNPSDIPRLLTAALKSPEAIIIGARKRPWRIETWHRTLANRIADFWISWAAGYPIADSQSGFRVYPASLLQKVNLEVGKSHSFVFESEILIAGADLGHQSIPVPIESEPRPLPRPSYFRPILDIVRITKMVGEKLLSERLAPRKLISGGFMVLTRRYSRE